MPSQVLKGILLRFPRLAKQSLAIACDLLICAVAGVVAMDLRSEQLLAWGEAYSWMLLVGAVLAVPVFTVLGLHRAIFCYAGLQVRTRSTWPC